MLEAYHFLCILCSLWGQIVMGSEIHYTSIINASTRIRSLDHFWESTGFCPPEPHQDIDKFISTNDMAQNVAYIGSVPKQGIKQVRIHWLLDLVSTSKNEGGTFLFGYKNLDKAMDLLIRNGLKPGFELMGNPSNYFTDFDDPKQIYVWRDLVHSLGQHLIERYGLDVVSSWNFESWNEPQNKKHFDGLHVTLQGYLNYYDACSEGLRLASPYLRLGGPGSGNPSTHPIFWALIDHCYHGVNFFTGEKGVRLDFISFHIKGGGSSLFILETESLMLQKIKESYPHFVDIPVFNDEADPLVGWSKLEGWRADSRYAAIVVKIIAQHQNILIQNSNIRYTLLSNDNGFLSYPPSYFTQRTLLARFQMNTSHPRKVELVKKPILSVMGLLALLGDKQVPGKITTNTKELLSNDNDFGMIASTNGGSPTDWQLSVIFYNSNDTSNKTGLAVVSTKVVGIPVVKEPLYVLYQVDDQHGNPYRVWVGMKSPVFPTDEQFAEMRSNEEPVRVMGPKPLPVEYHTGQVAFKFNLPLPGVALLLICAKTPLPPHQVEDLRILPVSSYEVLLSWKHPGARCIKTYEVLYSDKSDEGPYTLVNSKDLIFCAFLHSHKDKGNRSKTPLAGWYRVKAIDYWGRGSILSQAVKWSGTRREQDGHWKIV